MVKCKKPMCRNKVKPPGLVYCKKHRKAKSVTQKAWRRSGSEAAKRANARHKAASKARTALKQKNSETHRQSMRRSARRWNRRHPDRKRLIGRFGYWRRATGLKRPKRCEWCDKKCRPVPVGLTFHEDRPRRDPGRFTWDAWVCWSCYFEDKYDRES